ncbi:carboxypeptidase-like regulatory domain-containing protein [Stygiolobus caldivivus]|uniref:Uncharacterized protein n=1 Tax=Stygiolobus caldivivus TaxID=2824673 RepID=A0A8D5U4Z8_9CREN|nr:carboxypeptidase-like regulatory domain-containing protein [Stygiolobus caldivivus]BCU69039.1 hypothetical protein KN1_03360 [Stygiolobus caldivivus]
MLMFSYHLLEIAAIIISVTIVYYYLSKKSTLIELYFSLVLLILFISGSLIEILHLLLYSSFYNLAAYILLVGGIPYLFLYAIRYYKLVLIPEVLSFILVSIIIISITGGVILNQAGYSSNLQYIVNPRVDTTPLFYDYMNLLRNSSFQYQVELPSNLQNQSIELRSLILNFTSCLKNLENLSDIYYQTLKHGYIENSHKQYIEELKIFENLTTYYNKIQYTSRYLARFSLDKIYQQFLVELESNYTKANEIINNLATINNLISSLPNTSHIPIYINLENKILFFNKTNAIKGEIIPVNYYGEVNGTVIVNYLNYSLHLPVINNTFSFNFTLNKYLLNVTFTIIYSGNSVYLPNISTFILHSNLQKSLFIAKILSTSEIKPGGYLIIKGYASGLDRTLIANLYNQSKIYTVSGNFTITYPLPYNLTNTSYTLNLTLLPKGIETPSQLKISFIPRLYNSFLTVDTSSKWIIPSLLTVSGRLTAYNGSGIPGIKVFVFVGNQRYEAITNNEGYFSVHIKPKLTVIYGKQVIYVESDPQYYYYKKVASTYTTIYNPLAFIIPLGAVMLLYILRKIRKKNRRERRKDTKLVELKVR